MPSVTCPGASSSVWYQPMSLARSRACTAHTLGDGRPLARSLFERVLDRFVVRPVREAGGSLEAGLAQPPTQFGVLGQTTNGCRERVRRVAWLVDDAVLLVPQVLGRAARAGRHHG